MKRVISLNKNFVNILLYFFFLFFIFFRILDFKHVYTAHTYVYTVKVNENNLKYFYSNFGIFFSKNSL